MKKDSGLVDTIRGYLQNGGQTPESIQNNLNLSEDFVFLLSLFLMDFKQLPSFHFL